jgi:hypothetical protein
MGKSIKLGRKEDLEILFSYPNIPDSSESLSDTILHWIHQSLRRDGEADVKAAIRIKASDYYLDLKGATNELHAAYKANLPRILKTGRDAWRYTVPKVKKHHKWDPDKTGLWRFFMTHGVGIANYRSLQFFHYPPVRLLNPLRDSMHDPVTARVRNLLIANGVSNEETKYYETRINSTPIAADDFQGTSNSKNADPNTGSLIPIDFFKNFQKEMIRTLIKRHDKHDGYTIPIVVYGRNPGRVLGGMFLEPNVPMIIQILDGLKTPVLHSNHPYRFYPKAQGVNDVGKPRDTPKNVKKSRTIEIADLAVVRWQIKMAQDPSQDPWKVSEAALDYWNDDKQAPIVSALMKCHASLSYYEGRKFDPEGKNFHFEIEFDQALCRN